MTGNIYAMTTVTRFQAADPMRGPALALGGGVEGAVRTASGDGRAPYPGLWVEHAAPLTLSADVPAGRADRRLLVEIAAGAAVAAP